MNSLESMLQTKMGRCNYYRQKIAEHTPPKTESDHRMIRIYHRFLHRDRSFLQNLNLLRPIEEKRGEVLVDATTIPTPLFKSTSSLDVNELKSGLDASSEDHPNSVSCR